MESQSCDDGFSNTKPLGTPFGQVHAGTAEGYATASVAVLVNDLEILEAGPSGYLGDDVESRGANERQSI